MNQAVREYQRQRQMGIGDLLLENRIVFLDGVITDGAANMIVMKLLFLQSENRHQDIHLYVNSPGGSVTATMAIYDTMQFLECDVATYCVGLAASGGAVLVAGGTTKKRYCLPHSKMMIHQPYGEVGGQVSDIEIQAKDILRTREILERDPCQAHRPARRSDFQRHRSRPVPDGRRSGGIRPGRRDPAAARKEERQEIARKAPFHERARTLRD